MARALALARQLLARRGVDSPELSAQLLMGAVLNLERIHVLLERGRILNHEQWRGFWKQVARRSLGEPAAYILGRKEFYGRPFAVNRHVLTPRPETEHVVEAVLQLAPRDKALYFADLGTGSGILAVTLALELPRSRGLALDICPGALDTARRNAAALGALNRLLFVNADFAALPLRRGVLDILVSNPPYVAAAAYDQLSPEITRYEPKQALVPLQRLGATGLESIAAILPGAFAALRPGGLLLFEIGSDQERAMRKLVAPPCWENTRILPDLAGLPRVVVAQRAAAPDQVVC